FVDEIAPITIESKGAPVTLAQDEHPRDGVTAASLAKLPPVFDKNGSVHAGNSSGITDGAAALVLMSSDDAKRRGLAPLAKLGEFVAPGGDPEIMGIGPVPAVRELLRRRALKLDDFDLVELNEAFAAQVLACDRDLKFAHERLNVNGGSIALGHPIGC